MTADALPQAASVDHLTITLRQSGVLGDGRVSDVSVISSFRKLRSHTRRLRLDYDSPGADAPHSLILKTGHLDRDARPSYANRNEIAFYREVAPTLPGRVVPRCFEAVEATDISTWHLLLEDLTDSHVIATEWPLPPTMEQCESMVRTLARFHAAWWDHPRLGISTGRWRDTNDFDRDLQNFAKQFEFFIDRFGQVMPSERRDLYERLFDQSSRLLARYHSRRNLTIVHGDAHCWNFFMPRQGSDDKARLIDWESWGIDAATDDLAYMMAMLWYPDRRHRTERRLLDHYHMELLAHGVSGYNRQSLDDDYRLSALWLILRPVRQAAFNIPPRVWWPNLERIFLAFDDLGCRELLG